MIARCAFVLAAIGAVAVFTPAQADPCEKQINAAKTALGARLDALSAKGNSTSESKFAPTHQLSH